MASKESELIDPVDGLPADEVGPQAKEKHEYLRRYLGISSGARKKFIGNGKAGAVYFDLFCASGRSRIRGTNEWIDGSAVTAWKCSRENGAPFTNIYISDIDEEKLSACERRLRALGAPVHSIHASAADSVEKMVSASNQYALHLAFVDPFSLEALDFRIISSLSKRKRMDMLIHVSAMDLQRNLASNLAAEDSAFDIFAPGWRNKVNTAGAQHDVRGRVVEYWREQVAALGPWPSLKPKLITGERNQPLYWLVLAASNDLAHKFWEAAANPQGQKELF